MKKVEGTSLSESVISLCRVLERLNDEIFYMRNSVDEFCDILREMDENGDNNNADNN